MGSTRTKPAESDKKRKEKKAELDEAPPVPPNQRPPTKITLGQLKRMYDTRRPPYDPRGLD